MLEGLAVWALLIYILRLVGMPWNKGTKIFSVLGGTAWLLFVWVGMITYTPMDLSGGSIVQSPHIQLRPGTPDIKGNIDKIYVEPNQKVEKGQLIYTIDADIFEIRLNEAIADYDSAKVALNVAKGNVDISVSKYLIAEKEVTINLAEQAELREDLTWKENTLNRYLKQNQMAAFTVTESKIDEQRTEVNVAKAKLVVMASESDKLKLDAKQAELDVAQSKYYVESAKADVDNAEAQMASAEWNLDNTQIFAPADGYLSNFIAREGQYIGILARMQMYTNEKYVLMRVNHQAIRNVAVGQRAEFTSAVYPGVIFNATVEGIIEATGESQASLLTREASISTMTGKNVRNKHHFVRLKLHETEGHDIPVGAVGMAWISGEKPIGFMNFLDVIRGVMLRIKSQIYFFYSL